jgi:Outer membrane protein beta-barrel domain
MRRSAIISVIVFLFLSSLACFAQQDYVSRYDGYVGWAYLSTPNMNLSQRGLDTEFGVNVRPWLSLGADFSYFTGHSSILPHMLNSTQLAKLAPILPLLPPGYNVFVPYGATTESYSAGTQFNYRHFKKVTLFVRPDLGAFHQSININPQDQIIARIVQNVLGKRTTSDTEVFYGVGGGMDFNVSRPVGIRVMADFVHTNLFSNLLKQGQNNIRFSISPTFRFGRNIMTK